jgi:hypothetical protein
MNNLTVSLIVVIGILGGFYFGAKYGQGHPPAANAAAAAAATAQNRAGTGGGAAGAGGGGGGAFGGGGAGLTAAATGPITAVNGTTITVQDRATGKLVKIDVSNARITRTVQGTTSDLTANQNVTVFGQTASDGSVTAQAVTLGGAGGRGGGRPSPSPSSAQNS